jgi:hypothetical protein
VTAEEKTRIDAMSRWEMAHMWRFAKSGEPLLQGETGDYFSKRFFKDLGGFDPALSKALGWR